ncbi:Predicted metal-dependent phosphohydrolase, HD superfamily [Paenimyroides ummariense]|uniref:Predicted metal-dependent phosphohydrolase, HD superfamily n=1 Tax=Paenimyroides ummariense TaxID=913024 RepID=A0A1I5FKW9_9FLAO|nr:hypothetical protein [Paenimyroides ummariense]SFO24362.1 Predicted metal-dependent phosphohydrolase, HD superfamily [Paenimyroides ummariense]
MLKKTFIKLLENYTYDQNLINELWFEIKQNYSDTNRHYHTLQHLENLLQQLTTIQNHIQNWNTVLFTLYYHDLVYHSTQADNEEKSAELAEKRMKQALVPKELIEHCKNQILATKSHNKSTDNDTNYFTDADLSILGQPWEAYSQYYKNVRKEYSVYTDVVYNAGRKKVLQHFLLMDRIFKTDYFYDRFENNARQNIQNEIDLL